ncbi:MAG: SDR family oxidoreductase [Roseobacter sp.]|jgi:NAD(P)-dependent dehydrogenase (short-subunit alcohol dehydrogenase family)
MTSENEPARVALITGASGGLGSATARALSRQGFRLVLMSRSGCKEIAAEVGGIGIAGSVLEDADVSRAVDAAINAFGRLDAAVFGAGRHSEVMKAHDLPPSPAVTRDSFGYDPDYRRDILDIPWAAWHDDFEMMVLAPMRLAKVALPHLAASGKVAFVAISGIEAGQPRSPFPMGPTRLALQGFIKLLSDRYGREGVRFNTIAPGLMESAASEFHPEWADTVPLGRVGQNDEVGEAIAFLVSEASSYITGQCLTADGGVNRPLGL